MSESVAETDGSRSHRRGITVFGVYGAGLLQGISLIMFPAAGPVLTSDDYHGLTDGQFGIMFTPMIVGAIFASALAPAISRRIGMKRVLIAGLGADVVAMALLASSHSVIDTGQLAFAVLLVATTAIGAGFGATITALNAFAFELFPKRQHAAVTGLHVLTGLGQAGASLALGAFIAVGAWWGAPILVGAGLAGMIGLQVRLPLRLVAEATPDPQVESTASEPSRRLPVRLWVFAGVVFLYGAAEATFGNWSSIYLEREAGLTMSDAALGLSAFWASVTLGRLIFAVASTRMNVGWLYPLSPLAVAIAFFVLPLTGGGILPIAVLVLAGLGLSYFFPFSISLASTENPRQAASVSGILVAAIMLGTGFSANAVGILNGVLGLPVVLQASSLVALMMFGMATYLRLKRPAPNQSATEVAA